MRVEGVPEGLVEGKEDGKLDDHRQTAGGGIDPVLAVELHCFFLLLGAVVFVFLLDFFYQGLYLLHVAV